MSLNLQQLPHYHSTSSLNSSSATREKKPIHHHNTPPPTPPLNGNHPPPPPANGNPPPPPHNLMSNNNSVGSNIHIRPPNSSSPFASSSVNASSSNLNYFSNNTSSSAASSPPLPSPGPPPPSSQQQQQSPHNNSTTNIPTSSRSTTSLETKQHPPNHAHPISVNSGPLTPASFNSNRPAKFENSLFHICHNLKQRFETIPSLKPFLDTCYVPFEDRKGSTSTLNTTAATQLNSGLVAHDKLDPVTVIWRFFRLGSSLCALFNLLEPNALLKDSLPTDVKASKRAVYDFVQGCKAELGYSDDQLFTISNVFSDNTHDLLKVIHTVQLLLKTLESRDLLPPFTPVPATFVPKDKRDMVVNEFLDTERKFVEDLEVLVKYQAELQKTGILSVDTIHAMFPNLMALVDFQRRFLVGVEFNATLPPEEQRYGALFESLEEGFEVFKGYSLNQPHACELATAEVNKLQALSHIVEPTYELQCILIKPVQRICKYPLLFKELIKYTPETWSYHQELYEGLECSERITSNVNESQRQVENNNSLKELQERLRDWRGHNLSDFGELLHEGIFPVVKTGFEREYHLYLFENIILCCKESNQSKKSNPLSKKPKDKSNVNNNSKRSSLVLKGRIYMAYITNVTCSKRDNGYFMHISWGQDDALDTGFFDIRFRNEELLNQWESTIRKMVARYQQQDTNQLQHTNTNESEEDSTTTTTANDDSTTNSMSGTPSLNSFKPLPSEPEINNATQPAQRTMSGSSAGSNGSSSTSYFPYSSMNSLPEEFGAFTIVSSSKPSKHSSTNNNSSTTTTPNRNRSASTPSLTHVPTTGATNGKKDSVSSSTNNVPPMPPLPSNVSAAPTNSRIKSESAAVDRSKQQQQQSQQSHINIATGQREQSTSSFDSNISSGNRSISSSSSTTTTTTVPSNLNGQLKVKLHYIDDSFLIIVPSSIKYSQLLERIERKIRLCGKQTPSPLRIKYKDEDDDFVSINSDEDIQMALELSIDYNNINDFKNSNGLTLWVA